MAKSKSKSRSKAKSKSTRTRGWAQLPSRGPKSDASKPGPRKPLPPDVVGVIAGMLHREHRFATVAHLALLDKASFEVVIPRLYHTVTITSLTGIRRFLDSIIAGLEAPKVIQDDIPHPAIVSAGSPAIRVALYTSSMHHLEIDQDCETRSLRENVPGSLQRRIDAWRANRGHIKIETMHIEHHNSFTKDSFWLKAVFGIFQARHLYWRDYAIPQLIYGFGGQPMFLPDVGGDKAQTNIVEEIRKWDDDHFVSYDTYKPQRLLPLSKYRYTLCEDQEEWLAEPYWDIKAVVQDWLASWLESEERGEGGTRSGGSASGESRGPVWLFFNPPRRFMDGVRAKVDRAGAKEKAFLDPFHFVRRPDMRWGMNSEEWRAWVQTEVWSGRH